MVLENLLNPILNPLLPLGPFWAILIVSLVVSLITTIIYKYATNQHKLRSLKADLKRYQKKMTAASKSDPKKAMSLQKDIMKLNGQYMKASMKSTLYTFLPIIIFFGWLGAHFVYAPLLVDQPFNVTVQLQDGIQGNMTLFLPGNWSESSSATQEITSSVLTWDGLSSPTDGMQDLRFVHEPSGEEQYAQVLITKDYYYSEPVIPISDSKVFSSITIGNKKLHVFDGIFIFKDLPIIKNANWFWSYFIFSIIFSTVLRKVLKLA